MAKAPQLLEGGMVGIIHWFTVLPPRPWITVWMGTSTTLLQAIASKPLLTQAAKVVP